MHNDNQPCKHRLHYFAQRHYVGGLGFEYV